MDIELDQQGQESELPDSSLGVKLAAEVFLPIEIPGLRGDNPAHSASALLEGTSSGKASKAVFDQDAVDEVVRSLMAHGVEGGLDIENGVILLAKREDVFP
jgi:hypothetical protein